MYRRYVRAGVRAARSFISFSNMLLFYVIKHDVSANCQQESYKNQVKASSKQINAFFFVRVLNTH